VVGSTLISYNLRISPLLSIRTGNEIPYFLTKAFTSLALISTEIAIINMPLCLNSSHNLSREGISSLQGSHHVAQKLRRINFPMWLESLKSLPLKSFSLKSGAPFLIRGRITPASLKRSTGYAAGIIKIV